MNKIGMSFLLMLLIIPLLNAESEGISNLQRSDWEKVSKVSNNALRDFIVSSSINEVFMISDDGFYLSKDGGMNFRYSSAWSKEINAKRVYQTLDGKTKFLLTQTQLLKTNSLNKPWLRSFTTVSNENECLSFAELNDYFVTGMEKGIYISKKEELSWKSLNRITHEAVIDLRVINDSQFLAVTKNSVFLCDIKTNQFDQIFSSRFQKTEMINNSEESDVSLSDEIGEDQINIFDILFIKEFRLIILVAREGFFISNDLGQHWEMISSVGFPNFNHAQLTYELTGNENSSADEEWTLVAGTDQGAFLLNDDHWTEISNGLEEKEILQIKKDDAGQIWCLTSKNLYKLNHVQPSFGLQQTITESDIKKLRNEWAQEPSVKEVQNMAVEYADVNNNKIQQWKKSALKKAWYPKVTMGLSEDKNITQSDNIWGTYSGGGQLFHGPDDKTFYDNMGWDISLSWDLGEVIWNDSQLSIDSRAKLMVELRDDILDQVTRLYFERRRVQSELLAVESTNFSGRLDMEMKLDELTALINALTGGAFKSK